MNSSSLGSYQDAVLASLLTPDLMRFLGGRGKKAKSGSSLGQWVTEYVLSPVPHRQYVFTVPKMLRVYFR
ncbi:MAG: hypothetical protein V3S24_16795, partial [Candidatus Tectomicrobia bacterium]